MQYILYINANAISNENSRKRLTIEESYKTRNLPTSVGILKTLQTVQLSLTAVLRNDLWFSESLGVSGALLADKRKEERDPLLEVCALSHHLKREVCMGTPWLVCPGMKYKWLFCYYLLLILFLNIYKEVRLWYSRVGWLNIDPERPRGCSCYYLCLFFILPSRSSVKPTLPPEKGTVETQTREWVCDFHEWVDWDLAQD